MFGGALFSSVGTSSYLWPGVRFQLHARKWKWILGIDSLESFIFVQNYLISIILRQDCLHESESGVDSSLFSESVVLIVFYLQYLKRSRLTWKCSSNKPNSERQPLIAVKRDNIKKKCFFLWKTFTKWCPPPPYCICEIIIQTFYRKFCDKTA